MWVGVFITALQEEKHVLSTCQQAGMDPTRRTTSGLPSFSLPCIHILKRID